MRPHDLLTLDAIDTLMLNELKGLIEGYGKSKHPEDKKIAKAAKRLIPLYQNDGYLNKEDQWQI